MGIKDLMASTPTERKKGNKIMYIGNNFMVSVKLTNGLWHNEYFIDEKSAREYANRIYKGGKFLSIELLQRQRVGYVSVKKIIAE